MSNKTVAESLKVVLANSYALYVKTQNFHWNVEGPNFQSLHTLFEEQYTELAAAVDEIAERIRALGEKAPGAFSIYSDLASIPEANENADANSMLKTLADDQQSMVKTLNAAIKIANEANDEATMDLMINRIAIHEKNAWMLKSSIG